MRSGGVSRAAATPIAGMAIGWYAASGAVNQPRRCHALSRQMTAARRTFVDTNVLLYAHDASETERQPIARALLEELWARELVALYATSQVPSSNL